MSDLRIVRSIVLISIHGTGPYDPRAMFEFEAAVLPETVNQIQVGGDCG